MASVHAPEATNESEQIKFYPTEMGLPDRQVCSTGIHVFEWDTLNDIKRPFPGLQMKMCDSNKSRVMTEHRRRFHSIQWFWIFEVLLAIVLFVSGTSLGCLHLSALNNGKSAISSIEMLYGPAVMLASGRGFYQPDLKSAPVLRAFLRNETETLLPEDLPDFLPEEADLSIITVSAYHRYLLYTVAFFWRILGISWSSLEPLAALLLGVCAIAVYGLMRLGMGRILSATLALFFVLSPQMLTMLPSLRDFSKAPFLLLLIFILGALIKYRIPWGRLMGLSLFLGFLHGIALGFRQDAIVFVPPALIVLLLAGLRDSGGAAWRRALPVVLYASTFMIAGAPMLGRMEGGAQPYHPMVQGFSMKRAASLGMEPGAYEPLASGSDNYAFSMLYDYYERTSAGPDTHIEFNGPGSEIAGRQYLLDMGRHFPADLLARGYAALLRTFRYTDGEPIWSLSGSPWKDLFERPHSALSHHLRVFGLIYAGTALLLISAHSPVLAFIVLVFLLYVCGYVSLQCEFRHAFHLSFVPLWILGFLVQHLFSAGLHCRRTAEKMRAAWPGAAAKIFAFSLSAVVMMLTPLYVLRFYQHHQAEPLLETVAQLERSSVPVQEYSETGWTRYMLARNNLEESREILRNDMTDLQSLWALTSLFIWNISQEDTHPNWHAQARYFALELSSETDIRWLILLYESAIPWNNFSQLVRIRIPGGNTESCWYFFPAYELKMPSDSNIARNRFSGIALPQTASEAFRGLYEITDPSSLRFLMHVMLPDNPDTQVRLHQNIVFAPDPVDAFRVDDEPVGVIGMADAAGRFGKLDEARLLYEAALLLNRDAVQRLFIALALLEYDMLDVVHEVVLECAARTDVDPFSVRAVLEPLLQQYGKVGQPERAQALLLSLQDYWGESHPEILLNLVTALAPSFSTKFLIEQYGLFLNRYPEYEEAANLVDALFQDENNAEERLRFWEKTAAAHPESVLPLLRLGMLYTDNGDETGAKAAYRSAHANDPTNRVAALMYAIHVLSEEALEQALTQIKAILDGSPELKAIAVRALELKASRLSEERQDAAATRIYSFIAETVSEAPESRLQHAAILMRNGQTAEAQYLLEGLLDSALADQAVSMIGALLIDTRTSEERVALWKRLHEEHPRIQDITVHYAGALFDFGDYTEVVQFLESLPESERSRPECRLYETIARMAAREQTPQKITEDPAWLGQPELKERARALLLQAARHVELLHGVERAQDLFRAASLLAPGTEDPWLAKGKLLENDGALEEALETYWDALDRAAPEEQPRIGERIDAIYSQLGWQAERLKQWQEYIADHSDTIPVQFHLGMAFEANLMWEQAESAYRVLEGTSFYDHSVRLRLGAVIARRDVDEGVALMQTASAADPQLEAVAAMLCQQAGAEYLLTEKPESAAVLYRLAAKYEPDDPFIKVHLGDAYIAMGDQDAARQLWRQVVLSEQDDRISGEAARRLDAAMTVSERDACWKEISGLLPDAYLPRAHQALALASAGAAKEALALCDTLSSISSVHPDIAMACGLVLCRADNIEAGLGEISRAISNAPHLTPAVLSYLEEIALEKMEANLPEQAERLMRKAMELGPDNLLYSIYLGRALLAQGKYEEATAQFHTVLMEAPESPNTAKLLDEAWAGRANPAEHKRAWQAIVEAHPDVQLPRQHLEMLQR